MEAMERPDTIRDVAQLDGLLSEPSDAAIEAMRRTAGDVLVLGVAGKMGPTLARMFGLDRDEALNPFNPFLTIYAATTRRTQSGAVISADEAVSRQEALRMMTSAAARLSFDEKTRGSIEVGKLADFVVLDTDIMTCSPERLRSIRDAFRRS